MITATERFRTAVVDGELTHSGDLRLARHISNAVLRSTPSGPRVVKESKQSQRFIDLAIASIIAVDVAGQLEPDAYFGFAYR